MARTGFSTKFIQALLHAQENPEIFVVMLEISHSELAAPLRYCNQRLSVVSEGITYPARTFQYSIPSEFGDSAPSMVISIQDTDHEISWAAHPIDSEEDFLIKIRIAVKSQLDTIEFLAKFNAPEDAHAEEGMAVFAGAIDHGQNQMYPQHAMTPESHPGIFGDT